MFVYSVSSGEWTWKSGSNTKNAKGIYGTKGVADPGNVPGARDDSISWIHGGNLWMFGGSGLYSSGVD